ncbi:hypothetical protein HK104_000305, partial [Borealophlyctis nickersoniae]
SVIPPVRPALVQMKTNVSTVWTRGVMLLAADVWVVHIIKQWWYIPGLVIAFILFLVFFILSYIRHRGTRRNREHTDARLDVVETNAASQRVEMLDRRGSISALGDDFLKGGEGYGLRRPDAAMTSGMPPLPPRETLGAGAPPLPPRGTVGPEAPTLPPRGDAGVPFDVDLPPYEPGTYGELYVDDDKKKKDMGDWGGPSSAGTSKHVEGGPSSAGPSKQEKGGLSSARPSKQPETEPLATSSSPFSSQAKGKGTASSTPSASSSSGSGSSRNPFLPATTTTNPFAQHFQTP